MNIELLPIQHKLLTSKAKLSAMVCGIGLGKTFTLAHYLLTTICNYPNSRGLVVANTYSQLTNATIPAIKEALELAGIEYNLTMGGAKKMLTVGNAVVYFYSLEIPDNIRGIEVSWICADEIAYSSQKALDVILGRLRGKNGPLQARFFTSPNSFNFFYDFIQKQNVELNQGSTKDNSFLPPEYYESLLQLYGGKSSPLARQELDGEFVNQTSNSVYFAFNRTNHCQVRPENPNAILYIGLDFNIGNMTATVMQYDSKGFNVIDTIILKDLNANTFAMGAELYKRYGARALIIPDSTANSRKTSSDAGLTDIKILKNMGLKVESTLNPRIKNRHNEVNMVMYKGRLNINPHCIELIKELETLCNDQDEGAVAHVSVNMGYVIHKLEPLNLIDRTEVKNPYISKK